MSMALRCRLFIAVAVASWLLAAPTVALAQCLECLQKAMASQWSAYYDEIVQSWENYKKTEMQVDKAATLPPGPQRDQLLAAAQRLHADAKIRWRYAEALKLELTSPVYKRLLTEDLAASQRALDQASATLQRKLAVFEKVDKKFVRLQKDALKEMSSLIREEDRSRKTLLYDGGAAAVAAATVGVLNLAQYLPKERVDLLKEQLKAAGLVSATTGLTLAQAPAGPDTEMRQKMKAYGEVGGFVLSTTGALLDMPAASRVALGRAALYPVLAVLIADAGHVMLARRQFEAVDAQLTKVLTDEATFRNRLAEDQQRVATLRATRDRAAEQVHRITELESEIAARTQK